MKLRRLVVFTVLVLGVLALDQGSKAWARGLGDGRHAVIDGYWDWEHAENPGAAFSTLVGGTAARVGLSIVAAAAIGALVYAAWRSRPEQRVQRAAYALILGGAAGNLVDRVRVGTVTDFVRWRIHDHLWPIFNVADAALLVGVALLFVASARQRRMIST
ncbi:MAG: signal peptidase II [Acidobacteriota bacterium]